MATATAKKEEKNLTMEDFLRIKRMEESFTSANEFKLYGVVEGVFISEPKPRMKDGEIMLNAKGEPLMYPQRCSIDFGFFGGSVKLDLNERFIESAKVGNKFCIHGRFGMINNFGSKEFGMIVENIVTFESMMES